MPMLKEFKQFAMRGNVVDMAVGIVIGGAFGTRITSYNVCYTKLLRSACTKNSSVIL